MPIEPKTSNILPKFAKNWQQALERGPRRRGPGPAARERPRHGRGGLRRRGRVRGRQGEGPAKLGKFAKFCKFLAGSFSAVLKRNFARKYAFDSIFQALQDLHTFAPLQSQNVSKKMV